MKNTIIAITLIFSGFSVIAQESFNATSQGNFLANGTVYVNYTSLKTDVNGTKNDISNTFQIRFAPKAGYFVIDDLAVGLELNIQSANTSFEAVADDLTTNSLFVGPFGRYYLENGLFGEALVGFGSSKTENDLFGEQKSSIFGFRVGAGYAFFLGDHVAVEPTLNYSWESQKPDGSDNKDIISSIFLGIGITAFF